MRLFIAVVPPPGVRDSLFRAAGDLEAEGALRVVRPENLHLTLKFLGETPEDRLEEINGALGEVAALHGPLALETSALGAFPSKRRARVVWAGLSGETSRLKTLASDVDRALSARGFEPEKRDFTPHVTLARARGRLGRIISPEGKSPKTEDFEAKSVELVESIQGEAGTIYEVLRSHPLIGEERPKSD